MPGLNLSWVRPISSNYSWGGTAVSGLAVDASGNVVVTGTTAGPIAFGGGVALTHPSPGKPIIFVAKIDPNNVPLWARKSGVLNSSRSPQIGIDPKTSASYVTGTYAGQLVVPPYILSTPFSNSELYILRYKSNGVVDLAGTAGGSEPLEEATNVSVVANAVFLAGALSNVTTFGGGPSVILSGPPGHQNTFVVRYNSDGGGVWGATSGDAAKTDRFTAVRATPAGDAVFAVGEHVGTIVFTVPGIPIQVVFLKSASSTALIVKYAANGIFKWAKQGTYINLSGSGIGLSAASDVACDSSGNAVVVGWFYGSIQFGSQTISAPGGGAFIVKYDPDGNVLWIRYGIGAILLAAASSVAIDHSGMIYVGGYFFDTIDLFDPLKVGPIASGTSSNHAKPAWFIMKFDSAGNNLGLVTISGVDDNGACVATLQGGHPLPRIAVRDEFPEGVYVAGQFLGAVRVGNTIVSAGPAALDGIIAKYV